MPWPPPSARLALSQTSLHRRSRKPVSAWPERLVRRSAARCAFALQNSFAGEIEVVGDMVIALEAAFGGDPGVIVIAGTGSIAYGRNSKGQTARAGGWGFAISDEGSGQWIGRAAVAATVRALDLGRRRGIKRIFTQEPDEVLASGDSRTVGCVGQCHSAAGFCCALSRRACCGRSW